jgi:hypothetical protein
MFRADDVPLCLGAQPSLIALRRLHAEFFLRFPPVDRLPLWVSDGRAIDSFGVIGRRPRYALRAARGADESFSSFDSSAHSFR